MNTTTRIATTVLALALLAGCGNKGPLVLPEPPPPIDPATVPATEPAPAVAAVEDPAFVEPAAAEPTTDDTPPPAETPTPSSDGDGNG
jgi:predicted small lipoprotein YifL